MQNELDNLLKKIQQLEKEVSQKDQDLVRYRNELVMTNQRIEKMIAQVSEDLRYAGLIQKALSPTALPNISGMDFSSKFVPGSRFGGDYFDVFEHEDKLKFGIILSSASGYAMSALFLSVVIKMSSQIEARRGLEPNRVLKLMAQEIVPSVQTEKDRSNIFYGVVDRRSFELTYASVGSAPGFHFDAEKGKWEPLASGAPPLSKEFAAEIEMHRLSLNPRDRLVICSDGVVNATAPSGEVFGVERLRRALFSAPKSGVHELRNEILFQIEQFGGAPEFQRDLSIVVVEVRDRVIKLA